MGCDIHVVVERLAPDRSEWVGLWSSDGFRPVTENPGKTIHGWPLWTGRDYVFFAMLAGVRGAGPDAKGLPDNMSSLSRFRLSEDGDLHSHSYETLADFCILRKAADTNEETSPQVAYARARIRAEDPTEAISNYVQWWDELDRAEDFRVVFAFDN